MDYKQLRIQENYPITRLDRSLGLQEVEVPRICRHSAHKHGKIVRLTHPAAFTRTRYPWYSVLLKAESILRPKCGQKE